MKLTSFVFLLIFVNANCFSENLRIDCHPERNASKETCLKRQCLWVPSEEPRVPWCIFTSWSQGQTEEAFYGYNLEQFHWNETVQKLTGNLERRQTASLFGKDYKTLSVKLEALSKSVYHVIIRDQEKGAERIRILKPDVKPDSDCQSSEHRLDISFHEIPFGFAFRRKSSGTIIFDTTFLPGLSMAEQYMQISIKVPSQYVYGLGQTSYTHLKHDFSWRNWGFFARDYRPNVDDTNLYGVHPFYMCIDGTAPGHVHGVFFANSHAMNVAFQPNPDIITFRAIGGSIEFYLFAGPTPDLVLEQYTSVIGRPNMPPYWALGFHLSRFGYKNLTYLRQVFDRNRKLGLPQDVQFVDIDYMDNKLDFTSDPKNYANFSTFIEELHAKRMKLVLLVDPAISSQPKVTPYEPLTFGLKWDVFIKDNRTGLPLEGRVWPGSTYFPDFTKEATKNYWLKMLHNFHKLVNFDGIWIDMNEPSNFVDGSLTGCAKNSLNYPPYNPLIYDPIFQNTICLDADHEAEKHYAHHNLYGYTESIATRRAMRALGFKRPFILSRSTFAGSGRYTNTWTGDNQSKWSQMRSSIINILMYQMFGIPTTGADICGFGEEATDALCLRWHQLGAFYPFCRNHNSDDVHQDQDPAAWPRQTAVGIKNALKLRYAFLPYMYTLFFKAHTRGHPIWRPLFFDFITDPIARTVDDQFLLGHGLMVVPILESNTTTRFAYFPEGTWYTYSTNKNFQFSKENVSLELGNNIGLFLRGGTTIMCQIPAETTFASRQKPFVLIIAIDKKGNSSGDLYLDDGECQIGTEECKFLYLKFQAWSEEGKTGNIKITHDAKSNYTIFPPLIMATIYGIHGNISEVKVDNIRLNPGSISLNHDCVSHSDLYCWMRLQLKLDLNRNHVITWA